MWRCKRRDLVNVVIVLPALFAAASTSSHYSRSVAALAEREGPGRINAGPMCLRLFLLIFGSRLGINAFWEYLASFSSTESDQINHQPAPRAVTPQQFIRSEWLSNPPASRRS
ncbi:uncharacterized protein BDR25DRAFT_129500 [Lindgomyces ingoldianus]|uniref:Uncharacterized protein n=1 Tax=Lindgomyces ingoldianus TaxID=673940 RepID=A0ACB6R1X6_9PLEO|nr:uncharacterized protein BDR25DRAFT_129500 [Lindgomyces ingoldianus]KAF2473191.1 hypothetical protein BDR25DRAFT_129500 [Lindgomyces ingoldianus]